MAPKSMCMAVHFPFVAHPNFSQVCIHLLCVLVAFCVAIASLRWAKYDHGALCLLRAGGYQLLIPKQIKEP